MSQTSARAERAGDENVAHARAGSFERFVRDHTRSVLVMAYRITQNIEDARDVAQHVFLQTYVRFPDFGNGRSLDRWLYIVTRNEALSIQRRGLRDALALTAAEDDEPALGIEETIVRNERAQAIRATIATLPAADRNVIELRHLQALPTSEIAQRMGVPVKSVKRDVERAKTRLRVAMVRSGLADELTRV